MKLPELAAAAQRLRTPPRPSNLRTTACLATYPWLLATARDLGSDPWAWFCRVAVMTYGWMPRVLRLDLQHARAAAQALHAAREATPATMRQLDIAPIASSVRSVVGASKMLHFVNPQVYPIWDSRIEAMRLGGAAGMAHMGIADHYWRYCDDVHRLRGEAGFRDFHAQMQAALDARLRREGLPAYAITEVRAIELAASELSADHDEG